MTLSADNGRTLVPTSGALRGVAYTAGLVALDRPNTLLAAHAGTLLRSTDAGCSWRQVAVLGEPVVKLLAAPAGRAYGWSDNGGYLVSISGRSVERLPAPTNGIVGLGVDRADADRLRLGDVDGVLWQSSDGGHTWSRLAELPGSAQHRLVYRLAFDPRSFDHILAGVSSEGALLTTDGGRTWRRATGFSRRGAANVFELVVSPARSGVVWAMGIDLAEADAGARSEGRHVYRSLDGGRSFAPVVSQSARIVLPNGPLLAAHPRKAGVLYFVFGTAFQDYGTDLYRYDARTGRVTKTHNPYDDVSAIAFNPASPRILYLGLSSEDIAEAKARRP